MLTNGHQFKKVSGSPLDSPWFLSERWGPGHWLWWSWCCHSRCPEDSALLKTGRQNDSGLFITGFIGLLEEPLAVYTIAPLVSKVQADKVCCKCCPFVHKFELQHEGTPKLQFKKGQFKISNGILNYLLL